MAAYIFLAVAAVLVFYILVGYPLLLAWSFRRSKPVRKDPDFRPTVTVLLAVHNGERFIARKLEALLTLDYPKELVDIIVVSDGSTDTTDAIVQQYEPRGVQLIRAPKGGKPAALNLALPHAKGEILFFNDVRQTMRPDVLRHLVANFADPEVGCVTGEYRYLNPQKTGEEADMELYYRYELWVRRRHAEIDSACNTTGCIYALRRSLAAPIPPDTLTDDLVTPLRALFRGYRIVVEPKAAAFDYPSVEGGEFRRKMRTLAGLYQAHARLPELFTSANRIRLHFLSHKTARLALPWAILAAVAATVALPASDTRTFLLLDELTLPALALLDCALPKRFPLKRLTSPARSFLAMNAASLAAIAVFFVPAKRLWKPTQVKALKARGQAAH